MWFCIVGIVAFAVFVISKMLFPNWMKDHPWVGATAIFIDIGMLIGIGHMNPLVTAIILMTIVAFIALWSVLCVIGIHGDGRTIKSLELDQSTLKSSKKSLTNGAAILSVISCYTTANWYARCCVRWMARISSIYRSTGHIGLFKLFLVKIYPCCAGFKLAESCGENRKLYISACDSWIFDNVISI